MDGHVYKSSLAIEALASGSDCCIGCSVIALSEVAIEWGLFL